MEEDLAGLSTQEQTTMWLANTIIGATELQRLYPGDYRSAFTLGQAYHLLDGISNKDMSKDAIKYYKRAITLHPFMFKLRDKLAQIYVEKGYYQEAIHELKEAIRITPGNPVPYINLTNIFIKLGRHEDARKTCNSILELIEPVISKYSKYNEYAKNKLEFLSKSQATDSPARTTRVEKGHYQEAIQELKEAIRITPGNPVPYINLTNIFIKLGRHEDARKTCNSILELIEPVISKYSKYNEYAKNKLEFLSKSQATGPPARTTPSGRPE